MAPENANCKSTDTRALIRHDQRTPTNRGHQSRNRIKLVQRNRGWGRYSK